MSASATHAIQEMRALVKAMITPRQRMLVEKILRDILPMVLVEATLRSARPNNNVRKMHYRGPLGIHLVLEAQHGEETGRSFIHLRRNKEWAVVFSCLPAEHLGPLETRLHTTTYGHTIEHNPAQPKNLPFFGAYSFDLATKREQVGRGRILPTYIQLAYWMTEFGEVAFVDNIVNIEAAERDIIALLVEKS